MAETPDYGVLNAAATIFPVNDLGELAARLGSPITHDRRGDVLWWDDFEWGFNKWETVLSGTGAAAALSSATARNGRLSCLLTGGSDASQNAAINHHHPLPGPSRLGLEASVKIEAVRDKFEWLLLTFDGALRHDFGVRYDDSVNQLQYQNAAGGYTMFATGVTIYDQPGLFYTGKLVVDPTLLRYVRFILNETTYDLTGIAGEDVVSVTPVRMQAFLRATSAAGTNMQAYVDDVILTQNEPPNPA